MVKKQFGCYNKISMQNKRVTLIILIFILALAAFLRFYNLRYMEFNADQALNPYLALEILHTGPVPHSCLLSSIGICNPPFFLYLLIPAIIISADPIFLTAYIALFNVLTVLLLFFFVKKFFNEKTALIAAAFLAVNPWAIIFSRTIWQQNVLMFFTLLFFWSLFSFWQTKKPTSLIWAMLWLGVTTQIHQLGILLIIPFIVALILSRKNLFFKNFLIGLLLIIILYFPFVLFEINHDWYSLENIFFYQAAPSHLASESLIYPLQLITTRGFNYTFGDDYQNFLLGTVSWPLLDNLLLITTVAALCYYLFKKSTQNKFMLLWFLILPLFLLWTKNQVYQHYFILGLPAGIIIISDFLNRLTEKIKPKIWRTVTQIMIFIIIFYQAMFSFSYLTYLQNNPCINGNHSQGYAFKLENIKKQLQTGENNFIKIHQQICSCRICLPINTQYILENSNLK